MATLMQLSIGALSCFIFILITRRVGPKQESRVYAVALVAAASIYVCFAIADGKSFNRVALEAAGLVLFSAMSVIGLRYNVWVLMLGWAAHPIWDMVVQAVAESRSVPDWYPVVCIGFDLFLAIYIILQVRGRRWPARAV